MPFPRLTSPGSKPPRTSSSQPPDQLHIISLREAVLNWAADWPIWSSTTPSGHDPRSPGTTWRKTSGRQIIRIILWVFEDPDAFTHCSESEYQVRHSQTVSSSATGRLRTLLSWSLPQQPPSHFCSCLRPMLKESWVTLKANYIGLSENMVPLNIVGFIMILYSNCNVCVEARTFSDTSNHHIAGNSRSHY